MDYHRLLSSGVEPPDATYPDAAGGWLDVSGADGLGDLPANADAYMDTVR